MDNTSYKFWKGFSILLILLNLGLITYLVFQSRRPDHPPFSHPQGPANMLIEELKLSPEQIKSFNALKFAHHDSMMKLNHEGSDLREHYFDGLKTGIPSSSQDSLMTLILDNQKKKELVTYDHFAEVKKLCNSEQQVIFNSIIQDALKKLKPPSPHDRP